MHGNMCAQVINNNFIHIFPMTTKAQAGCALQKFVEDIGIPNVIVSDGAREQTGKDTEFMHTCQFYKVQTWTTKPYTPHQVQLVK